MTSEQPPPAAPQPEPGPTRLLRSRSDRMIAGVCGGVAAYLGVDAAIVRIATVVLAFLSAGAVLIGYLFAWLLIPEDSRHSGPVLARGATASGSDQARLVLGAILVVFGGLAFLGAIVPGIISFTAFWPLILIGLGVLLVVQGSRR